MISPLGFATRPRMPAICRTCIQLPRAPELTMRNSGFLGSNASCMDLATTSVACVQTSMSSWRRSSSVIRPLSYRVWIFAARPSYSSRISALLSGVATSLIEMLSPENVAQWKPASLSASRLAATSTFGQRSAKGGRHDQLVARRPALRRHVALRQHDVVESQLDLRVQVEHAGVEGHDRLGHVAEGPARAQHVILVRGQVEQADDHVLAGHGHRATVGRLEDVVG